MVIIWTTLGLWAASVQEPNDLLLGAALTLLLPSASVRVNHILRSISSSSESLRSQPHSPLPPLQERSDDPGETRPESG
jgi:hypothetical protein